MDATYQVEEESVPAAADRVVHTAVRHGGRGVRRHKHDIHRVVALALRVPPVVEPRLVCLAAACELPVLVCALGVPVLDQPGPDVVAPHVLDPPVVQLLDKAREVHVLDHDGGAEVVPLATAEERHERLTAVGEEQVRGQLEGFVG